MRVYYAVVPSFTAIQPRRQQDNHDRISLDKHRSDCDVNESDRHREERVIESPNHCSQESPSEQASPVSPKNRGISCQQFAEKQPGDTQAPQAHSKAPSGV